MQLVTTQEAAIIAYATKATPAIVKSVLMSMSVQQMSICVTKTQPVLTMMEAIFAVARQDLQMI